MRGSQTSEEAHRVVLEFKQREATARATASAVYTVGDPTKEERPRKDKLRTDRRRRKRRPGSPRTPMWLPRLVIRERTGSAGISGIMGLVEKAEAAHSPTTRYDKDLRKRELEKKGSGKGADGSHPAKNTGQRAESRGRDGKKGRGKSREASRGVSPKDRRADKGQKLALSSTKREPVRRGRQM